MLRAFVGGEAARLQGRHDRDEDEEDLLLEEEGAAIADEEDEEEDLWAL